MTRRRKSITWRKHKVVWSFDSLNVSEFGILCDTTDASCAVLAFNAPNSGVFWWQVPANIPHSGNYELELRFKLNDTTDSDFDSLPFMILASEPVAERRIYDGIGTNCSIGQRPHTGHVRSYYSFYGCITSDHRLYLSLLFPKTRTKSNAKLECANV
jgi:hypothetical protein